MALWQSSLKWAAQCSGFASGQLILHAAALTRTHHGRRQAEDCTATWPVVIPKVVQTSLLLCVGTGYVFSTVLMRRKRSSVIDFSWFGP